MKQNHRIILCFLAFQSLFLLSSSAQHFDFFYWVTYWPGAICNSKAGCCHPKSGDPRRDFAIHGLWPQYINGTWPSFCDPTNLFDPSQISDLTSAMRVNWPEWGVWSCPSNETKLWEHEWNKHGTCVESIFDQHSYVETNLKFKDTFDFLRILSHAGIKPNDKFYELNEIKKAINEAIGFAPGIECNEDVEGNKQLFQIYICFDALATKLVKCPYVPDKSCASDFKIKFPKFQKQHQNPYFEFE